MRISGWLHLEIKGKRSASEQPCLGRFYLDGANGAELSHAATITNVDAGTVRIDVYRYVLGETKFGGSLFLPRREDHTFAKEAADALLEVFSADDGNECWFVWKLELRSPVDNRGEIPSDFIYVVIAQSDDEARGLAIEKAGDEWGRLWADEDRSTCERIGQSAKRGPSVLFPAPEPSCIVRSEGT